MMSRNRFSTTFGRILMLAGAIDLLIRLGFSFTGIGTGAPETIPQAVVNYGVPFLIIVLGWSISRGKDIHISIDGLST